MRAEMPSGAVPGNRILCLCSITTEICGRYIFCKDASPFVFLPGLFHMYVLKSFLKNLINFRIKKGYAVQGESLNTGILGSLPAVDVDVSQCCSA